jgi:hypothetical protein
MAAKPKVNESTIARILLVLSLWTVLTNPETQRQSSMSRFGISSTVSHTQTLSHIPNIARNTCALIIVGYINWNSIWCSTVSHTCFLWNIPNIILIANTLVDSSTHYWKSSSVKQTVYFAKPNPNKLTSTYTLINVGWIQ